MSTVKFGAFEDLIPIPGTIEPFNSVFLDAIAGGMVEEVFVEEGNFVNIYKRLIGLKPFDFKITWIFNYLLI